MPIVSIVLLSYNQEKYIEEAIKSALNQTYKDFELMIVDDCSSDKSWEIISKYECYENISIYRFEPNTYAHGFRDIIKNKARGKYVAIHHSDDVWLPQKLEKQVRFLEDHNQYGACFTLVNFIDEMSHLYELPDGHVYKGVFDKQNKSKEEWVNYFFYHGNCLCHPSVLVRKEMYGKYGMFATDGFGLVPDFLQWIRLCMEQEIFIFQEKLVNFRLRRDEQENTSADKPEVRVRGHFELYKLLDEFKKINNEEKILKIFPRSEKFLIDGHMNVEFALAQLCLETNNNIYWLVGLDILFSLINDKKKAVQIQELYGYNHVNFIHDTAKYDIFRINNFLRFLQASIFIDYGCGFNEEDRLLKNVYVQANGDFYVEFEIIPKKKIYALRFDPDEGNLLKINIKNVKINNAQYQLKPEGYYHNEEEYCMFLTEDPQYILGYSGGEKIRIKINGNIKKMMSHEIIDILKKNNHEYQYGFDLKRKIRNRIFRIFKPKSK